MDTERILDDHPVFGLFRESCQAIRIVASYDAFISYRRSGGSDIAWALKTHLDLKGKKVFMDVDSLQSGPFDHQLIESIAGARNFILLLTPGSLERCIKHDDWVRKEISEALTRGKNIIPVFKEGFVFPALEDMPDEIRGLLSCNGVTLNHEYFYACIEKILHFMT